jgi:hypothetical protein
MHYLFQYRLAFIIVAALWTIPWKGYALWTSAQRKDKGWFIALLLINTFAILDIIYIFGVAKKNWTDVKNALKSKV